MPILLILFGLLSGCTLSILVGFIGRSRNIGFGWAFILSLLLTPLIGLIITLLSEPKQAYEDKSWGCLGSTLGIFTIVFLTIICLSVIVLLGV